MRLSIYSFAVCVLAGLASLTPAFAEGDVWTGGAEATLATPTAGNARVGGAVVEVTAPVGGDLAAWGADVSVSAAVTGAARLYAARAHVAATIGRDLTVMSALAELAPQTQVEKATTVNAARATVAGTFRGPLAIRAETVTFDGTAAGPAEITAGRLTLGPNASFAGDLTIYSDRAPEIPPGIVKGQLIRKPAHESPAMLGPHRGGWAARLSAALIFASVGLVAGLLFLWLGRGAVEDAIDSLLERTGWSGLVGVGAVVLLPLAALLLTVTLVGAPLAIGLLLALPLFLLLGLAIAGFGVGEFILNRTGEPRSAGARVLMLLLGLVVLALATLIPWIGPFIGFVATLFGFGALMRALGRRLAAPEPV
jgi:hypothetical protein